VGCGAARRWRWQRRHRCDRGVAHRAISLPRREPRRLAVPAMPVCRTEHSEPALPR
jgi:hypothetical protein